ncbi:MAG: hypothetical protein WDO70_04185 [Alphaproteobacteria bacterium]
MSVPVILRRRLRPAYQAVLLQGLPPAFSFTRASAANYFNASGALQSASSNAPRFDYDPVSGAARGLLMEGQSTNVIRNSALAGASVGAPGSMPTNMAKSAPAGVTHSVAGTGTEYGMPYIDVRFQGAPGATGQCYLSFEFASSIAAAQNDIWTLSAYVRLAGGTLANISSLSVSMNEFNSSLAYVTGGSNACAPTSTLKRYALTRTLSNVSTAFLQPLINFTVTSGQAIDVTFRFYQPQLEKSALMTSAIVTAGSAATRAADICTMPVSALGYNGASGAIILKGSMQYAGTSGTPWLLSMDDGTSGNRFGLHAAMGSPPRMYGMLKSGGSTVFDTSFGSISAEAAETDVKWGMGFAPGSFLSSRNGQSGASGASFASPAVTTLNLGGGDAAWNGWIKQFDFYNIPLTQAQLNARTI